MLGKKFYYDDPEGDALARDTSHPSFVKNMTAEFYYDCTDDFSPFGNDDGADLLSSLEEFYQEKKGKGNIIRWLFNTIDEFGFKYASKEYSTILEESTLKQLQDEDPHFLSCMDNSIIATAFGQIKISGQVDKDLKDLAIVAVKRQLLMNKVYENDTAIEEHNDKLNIMMKDLSEIE